jgi:uncharacterized integral membrane protein
VLRTQAPTDEPPEAVLAHDAERSARAHPLLWGLLLGTATVLAVVSLIAQNGESTRLEWLTFDGEAPLWLLMLVSATLGAVVLALAGVVVRTARRRASRRRTAIDQVRDRSQRQSRQRSRG